MLYLSLLILLTVSLYLSFRKMPSAKLLADEGNYRRLKEEYEKSLRRNNKLKTENSDLESVSEATIALYDITKDICKTLDEDAIFGIFKERTTRYLKISDCEFIKPDADLSVYGSHTTVLPLKIDKEPVGYLVAGSVREEDKEKFHILAQQFLVGIKRAFLYRKVQELTITDSLTRVFNRRYFLEKLEEEIARFNIFQRSVLGAKEKIETDKTTDIRNYAKYILKEGGTSEKRELLANLRSRIVYKDKKLTLLTE